MFNPEMIRLLAQGIWETLYMTIVSSLLAYVLGLPLGILLILTDKNGIPSYAIFKWGAGFHCKFCQVSALFDFIDRSHSFYPFSGWNISWKHCNDCTACVGVSTLCRPNGRILFKGGGSWRG